MEAPLPPPLAVPILDADATRQQRQHLAAAAIVAVLHIVLIVFVLVGPWARNKHLLLLYMMTIPFIHLHWITHNDTCALTLMECQLRGVKPDKSFFHRLVSPVYKFQETDENMLVWFVTFALWLVAIYRFYAYFNASC